MSSSDKPSFEQMKADLDRQRRDLVDTVDELSNRLDPRSQAKAAADTVKERAKETGDRLTEAAKQVSEKVSAVASDFSGLLHSDREDPWAFAPEPATGEPSPRTGATGPKEAVTIAAVAAAGIAVGVAVIAAIRRRR